MKIVVLQEDSSEANVSAEELRAHWEKLEGDSGSGGRVYQRRQLSGAAGD